MYRLLLVKLIRGHTSSVLWLSATSVVSIK